MDTSALRRATSGADNVRYNDRSTLAAADIGLKDANTSVKAAIKEMVEDALKEARSKKLTWNREAPPEAKTENSVGLWNPNLQGMTFSGGRYHVQNNLLLNAAGQEIGLEELSDEDYVWTDRYGVVKRAASDRKVAARALAVYLTDALDRDPMLCRLCVDGGPPYRCKDENDRIRHTFSMHPTEFAEIVGVPVPATEAELPKAPEAAIPEPTIICCGRTFKRQSDLDRHRDIAKVHGGSGKVGTE